MRLACTQENLRACDYALSNAHERLVEAWQAAGSIADNGGHLHDCELLWAQCVDSEIVYPDVLPSAVACAAQVERHMSHVRHIRDVTGWH